VALVVAVALAVGGCSSNKRKKRTPQSLQITTTILPDATERLAYSFTVQATGGNSSNYTWSIRGQPSWLTIDATTGELSGTPPAGSAGTYTFTVEVTDGQQTASRRFDLTVKSGATTLYVDAVNGSDSNSGTDWSDAFKTIAHALDVAQDGDTILVADGTYHEHDLDFQGKKVHLKSANGPTNCIIDCQQQGRAFYFHSGETADSILEGFTIQNGRVEDTYGGAIVCENGSSPTITNCIFDGNEAADTNSSYDNENGGAIYCDASSPTLVNCTFSGNSADGAGGAIFCTNSGTLTVTNCVFRDNIADSAGGAIYCDASRLNLNNCVFNANTVTTYDGGAIYCVNSSGLVATNCAFGGNDAGRWGGAAAAVYSSRLTMTNCTFTGNNANDSGGAILCAVLSDATLKNSILWNDSASSANEIYIYDDPLNPSSATLYHCCVDNTGYGGQTANITENNCIHQDPQFVNAAGGDYHLQDVSPCIDAGNNGYVPSTVSEDLDGNQRIVDGDNDGTAVVDIGAYEYQP